MISTNELRRLLEMDCDWLTGGEEAASEFRYEAAKYCTPIVRELLAWREAYPEAAKKIEESAK